MRHFEQDLIAPEYDSLGKDLVLEKYGFSQEQSRAIYRKLNEPHRHYHNLENHILPMLREIEVREERARWSELYSEQMHLVAIFHDIVYDPRRDNNEKMSANYLMNEWKNAPNKKEEDEPFIQDVASAIESVKLSNYKNYRRFGPVETNFFHLDLMNLISGTKDQVAKNAMLIAKEYQFVPWDQFVSGHEKVMQEIGDSYPPVKANCEFSASFIKNYRYRVGVYAGSFNPMHMGHMDIVCQGERIFDKVAIAVGKNIDKNADQDECLANAAAAFPYHQVEKYEGLLSEHLKGFKNQNVTLIRGLRNGMDFQKEVDKLKWMKALCGIPTIFLYSHASFEHVSSTAIRELLNYPQSSAMAKEFVLKANDYYNKSHIRNGYGL